ncbi:MAG TPA: GNAT family N-acetyltransferase [Jatrophihabitans sp.]|jgi:GNAT superfamily N-acetyltransferase|uniref:GNAT family N-acetyltransferase n=1 Tax=Jatrophihabitans sp. TaxID=1932789 RepID=UPI002DFC8392|nr:GNAT family N-acetyltransferase [Jatrophihabitans sp.]
MIRPVRTADVPTVLSLLRELADFEFEPDAVEASDDDLRDALFADAPLVFAHVAVEGDDVVGAAVWHPTFSTWTGRPGIHLTDLVVAGRARTAGHGQALFGELVRICRERGYARLDWEVCDALVEAPDRREPHGFYARQGASPRPGWTAWRMDAAALAAH